MSSNVSRSTPLSRKSVELYPRTIVTDKEENLSPVTLCLRSLLRPTIRFCLKHGIKLQTFVALAKEQFVELAHEELERSDTSASSSKVSVMTGVHRKDVSRFLSSVSSKNSSPPVSSDVISRIIGHWQHSPQFQTSSGEPKPLDCQGATSEFADLVQAVSKELSAYPILFELERISAVTRTDNIVYLEKKLYIEHKNVEDGYRFLAEDSEDLLYAVEENLDSTNETLNLHIKTEFDRIPEQYGDELRDWILREGTKFHEKVRKHLARHDVDINAERKIDSLNRFVRIAVGSFSRATKTGDTKKED